MNRVRLKSPSSKGLALGVFVATLVSIVASPLHTRADERNLVVRNADVQWEAKAIVRVLAFDRRRPPLLTFVDAKTVKDCKLNGIPCRMPLAESLLPLKGEFKPRFFNLTWTDDDGAQDVSIKILDRIPRGFRIEGRSAIAKHVFFGVNALLFGISPEGGIDYYREIGLPVIDFRPVTVGKKTYFSYGQMNRFNPGINSEGMHWILDENFQLFDVKAEISDNHEFLFLGKGHYVYTSYEGVAREGERCRLVQAAVEHRKGRDVHVVDSEELALKGILPPYGANPKRFGAKSEVQYAGKDCLQNGHLNAIQILDGDRWLVSFGDYTTFLWNKKERRAEWVLDGPGDQFGLTPEQRTSLHHTPFWFEKEGRLVLFDNGQEKQRSRILEYHLDTKKKKVTAFKEYDLGGFAGSAGNVEVDGDVFSVGMGHWETGGWDFVELKAGKPTFKIRVCPECPKGEIYRVYRGSFPVRRK